MASSLSAESRWNIAVVTEEDLVDLLPLLRSYREYASQADQIAPTTDDLLMSLSRALIANPKQEGIQLIVRDRKDGTALAFAILFWTWSTLKGGRLAVLNDLYVAEPHRGQGIADRLIVECAQRAREHGALCLTWQTSVDNKRAQVVYDRSGALRSDRWLDYSFCLENDK